MLSPPNVFTPNVLPPLLLLSLILAFAPSHQSTPLTVAPPPSPLSASPLRRRCSSPPPVRQPTVAAQVSNCSFIGITFSLLNPFVFLRFGGGESRFDFLHKSTSVRLLNVSYNNLTNMVSRGGPFESLDITSFLDNPLLCGSISGLLRCPKNKRQVSPFHSKKNFALMLATSASATFFVTTICCSVCYSLLKKVVFIARDRIDVRCNIPQPQELWPNGTKKAYVRLTPDYDALDVANKIGTI
ncbi:60S ribosomal protein L25 [Nymphaea thermarum]|nr:60S ribosomal protein L25 [Nymphaea thermarum]